MSLTEIRDAIIVALPVVWGGMTLWKRIKPTAGSMWTALRTDINKPVQAQLNGVEEKVDDLTIKVDTIVRLR